MEGELPGPQGAPKQQGEGVQAICPDCGGVLTIVPGERQVQCPSCGRLYPVLDRDGSAVALVDGPAKAEAPTLIVGSGGQVQCPHCGAEVASDFATGELRCPACKRSLGISGARPKPTGAGPVSEQRTRISGGRAQVKCPQCNAALTVGAGADHAACTSCGVRLDLTWRDGAVVADVPTVAADAGPAVARSEQPPVVSEPQRRARGEPEGLDRLHEHMADRYELLEFLGRGGMGAVYKARQKQPDRVVALKVMLGGAFASEGHRKRFEREAQAVARLQHPAIVPIYEFGEVAGLPYFTMEFVEGSNLRHYVGERGLGRESICRLMVEIAHAVDYAHTHGVIHRDLKPSNIMVGQDGRCRILDFGLARIAREDAPDLSILTLSGDVMGTPRYMSPEQALGRSAAVDGRTDVYSLGAIFYELVVGMPPYNLDGAQGYEALEIIRTAEPIRPSVLHPWMPADLEAILLKALEKGRRERYRTARALAEDIENFLAERPVAAQAATTLYRTKKLIWRNRTLILTAMGVVLLLGMVGGIFGGLWLATRDETRETRGTLENWAGSLENIPSMVMQLAQEGRYLEAKVNAELAERHVPPEVHGIRGLARRVRRKAEGTVRELTAELNRAIRAQRYDDAQQNRQALSALALALPFDDLKQRAQAKADSFEEDCWRDLTLALEQGHVYTREASAEYVQAYISRFGDGPHAEQARSALRKLRDKPDEYFLFQRLVAVTSEKEGGDWEKALDILSGARAAVAGADVTDEGVWNAKFEDLRREINSVIRPGTAGRVEMHSELKGHEAHVKSVAFRPDGEAHALISGSLDETVRVWDCVAGTQIQSRTLPERVRAVAVSRRDSDGRYLVAAGCEDGRVFLCRGRDAVSGDWQTGHNGRLQSLGFSRDGGLLLTASADAVKLWEIEGDVQQQIADERLAGTRAPAALSPTGRLVAATVGRRGIRVWAVDQEDEPLTLDCPQDAAPLGIAFSPDGRLLAAGCQDNKVRMWDLTGDGGPVVLAGHERNVYDVAFSPDGQVLASAGGAKTIILWDVRRLCGVEGGEPPAAAVTQQCILRKLSVPHDRVMAYAFSLAFSFDGKYLASGNDAIVRVWGVARDRKGK